MNKFKKTIAGVLGFAVALSFAVAVSSAPAKADAISDLLAQIAALTAQVNALKGGTATASVTFTRSLTIGSSGADVTALQNWLIAKGFSIPAGATGYFGAQTKAALAAYQAANGIAPAAGYFGPITMAKVNASAVATVPGTTPGTTPSGITTPGVEGTLTVTSSNSGLSSTVHEGETMVGILGAKVEAKSSDIAIQRVKLTLGSNTTIQNKLYKKFYVVIDGNVVASSDLNSSTVVKDGSTYYITIAGFNVVVPKGTTKQLVIKADAYNTIDSTDVTTLNTGTASQVSFTANGVRGVDGAGIDQYGPATAFGRTVTVSTSLVESATLTVSTDGASPIASEVIATQGTGEDEIDYLPLLSFKAKAEKDAVTLTDLSVTIASSTAGTGSATTSVVYLFDGSREIDSASVGTSLKAVFDDIDEVIAKDSTKVFTVKAKIINANALASSISASIASASDVTAENSLGDGITESGTATGETQYVRNVGPVFSLVSKTITTNGAPQTSGANNIATSTLSAVFTVKMKALGGPIMIGGAGSTTAMFANLVAANAEGATSTIVYRNSANTGLGTTGAANATYATSTDYVLSAGGDLTSNGNNTFTLAEGGEITIPVTFSIAGRSGVGPLTSGIYSVGLENINWVNGGIKASNFMAGRADWRTAGVAFP